MSEEHKCCKCEKAVDTTDKAVPPKWYGAYMCEDILRVICADCIRDPKNDGWWK